MCCRPKLAFVSYLTLQQHQQILTFVTQHESNREQLVLAVGSTLNARIEALQLVDEQ